MTFGQNLTQLRKSINMTRVDLAKKLCIPHTTLRNYETDLREPGHNFLINIAKEFEVSVDYLLGLESPKQLQFQKISNDLTTDEQVALDLYQQLDSNDKGEIKGEMKQMLKAEKYREEILEKNA